MTQYDLAELSAVSLRTIKEVESGKGNPSLITLNKIAQVLGMELQLVVRKAGE